jgi:hypothetical protein
LPSLLALPARSPPFGAPGALINGTRIMIMTRQSLSSYLRNCTSSSQFFSFRRTGLVCSLSYPCFAENETGYTKRLPRIGPKAYVFLPKVQSPTTGSRRIRCGNLCLGTTVALKFLDSNPKECIKTNNRLYPKRPIVRSRCATALADRVCPLGGGTLVCRVGQNAGHVLTPLTRGLDERTLLPSEERPDTILILHEPCHNTPQTLACQS